MEEKIEIPIPEEYSDICPISDAEFQAKMALMVKEPGFEHAIRYVMHDVDFDAFCQGLMAIKSKNEFQIKIMQPFLAMLEAKTTNGISWGGLENLNKDTNYTFITNHRDIVLDASFMNVALLRGGFDSTEVAIGNNLLILDWIETLVRLNKCFIVKRDNSIKQALESAIQLSSYIHFCINKKHESVWIAQREGRCKDSNDLTQESLIKMLGIAGGNNLVENLMQINLAPVAISYEFDPNDYLKAREFLLKRRDPEFKKTQRDDLFSMETGLLQYKGRVHFEFTPCINAQLRGIFHPEDKSESAKLVCTTVDKSIHSHYHIFPNGYMAYDLLNGTERFTNQYTPQDLDNFKNYLANQLAKVEVDNITAEEHKYLNEIVLKMYANPLINQLRIKGL